MSDPGQDHVVRAITMDGEFRVIAVMLPATAQGAIAAQHATGDMALRLAELLCAAVIVRETTQPARRVQMIWRDHLGGSLVADALPDGMNRGIISPGTPKDEGQGKPLMSGSHVLHVNYTLPTGALHQGVVQIDAEADVASALMTYMLESEQTITTVAIAALPGPVGVSEVGGYLIQILPEATREAIAELTGRVAALPPVADLLAHPDCTPQTLIARVLEGFRYEQLADSPLRFGCTCSEARVITSMLSLPEHEVDAMVGGDALEVRCDACGANYRIDPSSLRAIRELRARGHEPS